MYRRCVRTGCWGEYLALRGKKWQETGENCIMRSLSCWSIPVVSYTSVSQPGVCKLCLIDPRVKQILLFIFYAVMLYVLSFLHHICYFHTGIKTWQKTIPSIYISVYTQSKCMRLFLGEGSRYQKGWETLTYTIISNISTICKTLLQRITLQQHVLTCHLQDILINLHCAPHYTTQNILKSLKMEAFSPYEAHVIFVRSQFWKCTVHTELFKTCPFVTNKNTFYCVICLYSEVAYLFFLAYFETDCQHLLTKSHSKWDLSYSLQLVSYQFSVDENWTESAILSERLQ
jgi:hypothetical protein